MRITTIIIDDDADSRLIIREYIASHCPEIVVTGEGGSIAEAIKLFQKQVPDLVLLDISLPDGTAFEWLQTMSEKNFEIIFITAYNSYAIEAFRFAAIDYLMKPIADSLLQEALNRVRERLLLREAFRGWKELQYNMRQTDAYKRRIAVAAGNGYQFVELPSVIRLESSSNYTYIYLEGGSRLTAAQTLGHFESVLPPEHFCRIHHSHIVNLNYVERYEREGAGGLAHLKDGTALAVSQRKKESLLRRTLK